MAGSDENKAPGVSPDQRRLEEAIGFLGHDQERLLEHVRALTDALSRCEKRIESLERRLASMIAASETDENPEDTPSS